MCVVLMFCYSYGLNTRCIIIKINKEEMCDLLFVFLKLCTVRLVIFYIIFIVIHVLKEVEFNRRLLCR